VKEVTDLGLAYNLLTAYTSFVAVDSRVRNSGDKPETVNQPLPLPEGVSDHAVGGSGMVKTMALAPPPLAPYRRQGDIGMVRKEEAPVKDNEKQRVAAGPTVSIGDVTVSGGIAKQVVLETMRKIEGGMAVCSAGITGPVSHVVTLTVNADGTVKDVTFKDGKNYSREQCLKRLIKQLKFAVTRDGKEASATLTILLKP